MRFLIIEVDTENHPVNLPGLKAVIEDFSNNGTKLIFTMGKGGVGKTTIASAIAVGLVEKGHRVHLTTTDPAAHLDYQFQSDHHNQNLTISSINPKVEVEKYKADVIAKSGKDLDEAGLAYLKEDLESPCTEEIAVFQAFAEVVAKSENEIVVIDTAPTGHTLLLLDASQSYSKEIERSTGEVPESARKLLPQIRNPKETSVVIVTLAEATPVLDVEVGDVEARLRGQQVDRHRDLHRACARGLAVLEPCAQALERLVLCGRGLLAALRGLGDALRPALDRREVGEHELELDRVGVVERVDAAGRMGDGVVVEAAQHVDDRIGVSDRAEELVAQPFAVRRAAHEAGDVDHLERRRDDLARARARDRVEGVEPRVAHIGDAVHGLGGREHVRGDGRAAAGEGVEERRLAAVRQSDEGDLDARHQITAATVPVTAPSATPATTSPAWCTPA